jgi:uncharacterized protein YdhG (YjbR/CyaY superfamily)
VVDPRLAKYINGIAAEHRPLFDRLQGLILEVRPDAELAFSYAMPTYRVGRNRLFLAAWKHGVSIYGWKADRDGGFCANHPALQTSTGTIQLRPEDAAAIPDDEFRDLLRSALAS